MCLAVASEQDETLELAVRALDSHALLLPTLKPLIAKEIIHSSMLLLAVHANALTPPTASEYMQMRSASVCSKILTTYLRVAASP